MAAGPLLTGIVQESLSNILPDPIAAIQTDGVGGLDFHGPLAPPAGDAQDVALNFGEAPLTHLGPRRAGATVFEYRLPVFVWERRIWSRSGARRSLRR